LLSQQINPAANLQDIKEGTIASRRRNVSGLRDKECKSELWQRFYLR